MKQLLTTLLAVAALITISSTQASAVQGKLTAVFYNDCSGDWPIGINAIAHMEMFGGVPAGEYTLNIPAEGWRHDLLWLQCGQRVTKTLTYDTLGSLDYDLGVLRVEGHYVDNWRQNQSVVFGKMYKIPANGTTCNITYKGNLPPVPEISCSH